MHPQSQSPFFSQLPPEVRAQIQIEYLSEYLRQTAVDRNRKRPPYYYWIFAVPISNLSLSCKRMFGEMRRSPSPVGVGRRFAVFLIMRNGLTALVCEGGFFEWDNIRHVRFIHEMDQLYGTEYHWTDMMKFFRTLKQAPRLTELELDWNPRMNIMLGYGNISDGSLIKSMIEEMRLIPTLRTLRLRGKFLRPLLLPEALPGVVTVVEPISMWPKREEEEEDEEETKRKLMQSIAENKARLAADAEQRLRAEEARASTRWQRFQRKLDTCKHICQLDTWRTKR